MSYRDDYKTAYRTIRRLASDGPWPTQPWIDGLVEQYMKRGGAWAAAATAWLIREAPPAVKDAGSAETHYVEYAGWYYTVEMIDGGIAAVICDGVREPARRCLDLCNRLLPLLTAETRYTTIGSTVFAPGFTFPRR